MFDNGDIEKMEKRFNRIFLTVIGVWLAAALAGIGLIGTAIYLLLKHYG